MQRAGCAFTFIIRAAGTAPFFSLVVYHKQRIFAKALQLQRRYDLSPIRIAGFPEAEGVVQSLCHRIFRFIAEPWLDWRTKYKN